MNIPEIFRFSLWGNTILQYLTFLAIVLAGTIFVAIFKKIILRKIKKKAESNGTAMDDLPVKAVRKSFIPVLYFLILFLALKTLSLSETASRFLHIIAVILITVLVVRTIITGLRLGLQSYSRKSEQGEQKEKQLSGILGLLKIVIWAIALVFMLDNLGIEISAVAAGLGIGGIAVALAAQTVLGDLFSYFIIFFDKPFELGDFIIIGDKMGVVEHVGMKTTRIRALGGEQMVFSNTDLTDSRVHNYKKMERRRVVFKLGVVYQTPSEKLKKIPGIVKEIISRQEDAAFDRGHFASYGDFSLNFEFVYYVTGADYNKYMDIQQAINLEIYEAFEKEEISFAYPSQTLYVNKAES